MKLLYIRYSNKLEKLWFEYHNNKIIEDDANSLFFAYRNDDWEKIEYLDGILDIKEYKTMMEASETETANYLKNYHYE